MEQLLLYTSIPAILMALGGIQAFLKRPGPTLTSFIQHFAAGVVFAAVAVELIPKITAHEIRWLIILGFGLGLLTMFIVDEIGDYLSERQGVGSQLPIGLVTGVAIDVFIDGLLIGVAFLTSQKSGIFIALALALEVLFLGLATATKMSELKASRALGFLILLACAALIPFGGFIGFSLVAKLSSGIQLAILSFGVAALLYLVTEELLVEAHEVPETRFTTMAFFIGFLIILLFA